ncbi:phosphoribosyltransferase [Spirulina sp. CS-785/01]|uniref:phosphoribosyltransferase n=1 Tax=Spirulina sp. CS-785/01 TaxID=3021716 RepID=UPI00232ABB15|nr:phosphoribosyltransferase [Spirulina sp. CS-785/01]MDB9313398.1 phosphoribosyltransferase [Spirulina sp. CS-785/01]
MFQFNLLPIPRWVIGVLQRLQPLFFPFSTMLFRDRQDAGQKLGQQLRSYAQQEDVLVLGLARGGVPVAVEVAQQLQVPVDAFIVRKLGLPGHSEMAMGAIASGGIRVLNEALVEQQKISQAQIQEVVNQEQAELTRRENLYYGEDGLQEIQNRTIILVDDGIATGATMHVAALALRQKNPKKIIAAIPLCAPQTATPDHLGVDEVVCLETPDPLRAISLWYEKFEQVSDEEVQQLLQEGSSVER